MQRPRGERKRERERERERERVREREREEERRWRLGQKEGERGGKVIELKRGDEDMGKSDHGGLCRPRESSSPMTPHMQSEGLD